jgi:serine/threonine-protein kinase RsbW
VTASVVELTFPAHARYLVLARLGLAGVAQATPIDPELLADLKLAVTEACSNVVRHAYPGRLDGTLRVRIELLPDRLSVEVADHGAGFEPERVTEWDPLALRESGMGLSIIRSVVDDLEVGPGRDGVGTAVRFAKSLDG